MISWHPQAWEDYLYWQQEDKRILKRVNALIQDVQRNPFDGIGKPEPLKHEWSGFWSRRINDEHRLVYTYQDGQMIIAQCRYHY
ncbi:MAG: Txe/YoeB family addiction module toxin [Lamprobacter sp.]|uniref:Txe/YoeB family addiction module toxin n=1 Tax=Lamprobacter sp. TaxID=3100796 RepID=UPI002B263C58|nr:Txe/YoeB family addiction module toxin [Lamprobacter sp.]MEA3642795.1 Txe/YoeB family addiction module toxin [Lamprobacter sp.]